MATILRKSRSSTGCGGWQAMSEPMAGSRRGTLMVCGPTPKVCLEVADVLQHGEDLEAPVEQAEQHADADVVDAGLHGAVHGGDAPVVVLLAAAEVDLAVGLAVVGLLEELVGADAGRLELAELVDA